MRKNRKLLCERIKKFVALCIELESKGGSEEDGYLFEDALELQTRILDSVGLPETPDYVKLLHFDTPPDTEEINEVADRLYQAAAEYLSEPVKTDYQILQEGQSAKLGVFYVLPKMKIMTHVYTLFVYDEILLKYKDSIDNVLRELQLFNKTPWLPGRIGRLYRFGYDETSKKVQKLIALIEPYGLKYFQDFFVYSRAKYLTEQEVEQMCYHTQIVEEWMKSPSIMEKKGTIDYYHIDEEEYKELEELGLFPDHSSEKQKEKARQLLARPGEDYTDEELTFLGRMDLSGLSDKSQGLAWWYMKELS
jgi:hypothetical protein